MNNTNALQPDTENQKPTIKKSFTEIVKNVSFKDDLHSLKRKIEDKYDLMHNGTTKEIRDKASEEYYKLLNANTYSLLYLHKHMFLMNSVHISDEKSYAGVAYDLTEELKTEYGCTKPSEVILCQVAANAYVRIMRFSQLLVQTGGRLSSLDLQYYSILSKELDRAERQFHTALNSLRSAKHPGVKVNIKTNNAFIAENQQLNNLSENNNAS